VLKEGTGQNPDIEEESKDVSDDDSDDDDDDSSEESTSLCSSWCCAFYSKRVSKWIILDSQSKVDLFSNEKLLINNSDAKRNMALFCNTGKAIVTKKGDL